MKKILFVIFVLFSSQAFATPKISHETLNSKELNNQDTPYGDNPNIFRLATYHTGQTLIRLGNATQKTAESTSKKIKETWSKQPVQNDIKNNVAIEQHAL